MSVEDELRQLHAQVVSLTQRVYQLEQRLAGKLAPPAEVVTAPPPPARPLEMPRPSLGPTPVPPLTAPPPPPPQPIRDLPAAESQSLEHVIGSQWLNRVGIIAVLVGVSYFLKLAFDNQWIGPPVRVLIGLAAGIAIVWWSERFRRTNATAFAYSLKAIGIGILYLSLWASFQLYHLAPAALVFAAMVVVTAGTAAMALIQNSELLAGLALLGGYLTPVLLSTGENHEAVLLTYVALLSAGAVILQRFQHWPRIVLGAWIGSLLLYLAWADQYYAPAAYGETVFFLSLLFAIFAAAPFLATFSNQKDDRRTQAFAVLAVINGAVYFFEIFAMQRGPGSMIRASAYAIGLAALYFGLGLALRRREQDAPAGDNVMWQVHQGVAIAFLTEAIALRLEGKWITFGWLIESAVLYVIGARTLKKELKVFGIIVVALAIFRVVLIDSVNLQNQSLIFNQRFALYLLTLAVLAFMVWTERHQPIQWQNWMAVAIVAFNILAVTALCLEVNDFYRAQQTAYASQHRTLNPAEYARGSRALNIAEDFAYSAVLMAYGVGLMFVGFWKRSAFLRWQAIILIGVTVAKVFLYDMSNLDRVFRVASFIILGVILLAISYAYQKDWLGLQDKKA